MGTNVVVLVSQHRYYAAFDFIHKRVGFAPASKHSADICQSDLPMDITYDGSEVNKPSGDFTAPAAETKPEVNDSSSVAYVPEEENSGASMFVKVSGAFAGVALIVLLIAQRRRRRKTARFEEIASNPEIEFVEDIRKTPVGIIT
jgi:hypothetical protein